MFSWLVSPRSFILIVFFFTQNIFAAPNSLTFQAKIVKPNQINLEEPSVYFKFKYTDALGLCVVYEEEFTAVDMTGSKGLVSLELGAGAKTYPPAAITMYDVFNFGTALSCQGATPTPSVTPTAVERRKVIVQFNDGSGLQTLPIMNLNAVPFALHATMSNNSNQLAGLTASQYTKNSDMTAAGCVAGQALRYTGAAFVCETIAGAGVTTVTATAPVLSSGGANPNISIPKATSAASGYLASSDWSVFNSKLSNFSTLTSVDVTTALTFTPLNRASNLSDIASATTARTNLGLGTSAVLNVAASGDATATEVVKGNDSRLTGAVQSSTSLSGDVTGTVAATVVANVGGMTAANVATGATLANNATSANTASAIVRRNASGDFTAGVINATTFSGTNASATNVSTQNVYLYDSTNTDRIIFKAPTSGITNYTLTLPAAVGTNGQVLSTNASGDLSWVNAAGGSVTSVTATAPLVSSGGATPDISIAKATAAVSGYLASTDFTIFSNKLSNFSSMTSIDVTTALTYVPLNPISNSVTNAMIASVDWTKVQNTPTTAAGYNIPKATVGVDGYLSSTDFTTFNNKQVGSTELTGVAALSTIGFVKRTAANTYSTVASIDLTNSVTGVLPATNGGSGQSSFVIGDLLYANSTTTLAKLPASTSGYVLTTNGAGTAPTWTAVSAGTVTSVTAGAPLLSSGGATPNITMPVATNTVDGYLSSTDRTAFNAKLSNFSTMTSIDVTTALTYVPLNPLSNSVTNAMIASVDWTKVQNTPTTAAGYNIPKATVGVDGYLSSTDFTTFNNKQASGNYITALTSDVTLSGFSAGSATATIATSAITSAKILDGTIASNDLSSMGASTGEVMKWNGSAWIASADISNAGTVTSVTAAATANNPITIGGTGAAPTIDLAKSTTAINGYLSSTDFTTFNNKQAGSTELTGVAALSTIGFVKRTAANTYSTVASIDLTNSVTGVLPATNGGSGQSSFVIGDLLYANSTTTLAKLAASTSGYVLTTNGAGTAPTWTAASTGTVTSVTAGAPLLSSGGATPNITMPVATNTVDGYLSSTDRTAFNAKLSNFSTMTSIDVTTALGAAPVQNATNAVTAINFSGSLSGDVSGAQGATSVNRIRGTNVNITALANNHILQYNGTDYVNRLIPTCSGTEYLTFNGTAYSCVTDSGSAGAVASINVTAPVLNTGNATNPIIAMNASSATVSGYLSSADFSTFNNKQASGNYVTTLSGDVTSSGFSAGTVTTTIANDAITSSKIFDGTIVNADINAAAAIARTKLASGTTNSILINDGSGVMSDAGVMTNGQILIGSTGAVPAVGTVGSSNGISITAGAGSLSIATNGTTAAANNTLVMRDGSGISQSFGVGVSGATSGSVIWTAPSIVTNYSLQLPAAQGVASTVLQNNGSGILSWVAASTGTVTGVTATAPVVSSGGAAPVISMAQSTTTISGYLSSTDFTTFNNKQASGNYITALTSDVTLSGFSAGSATATIAASAITSAKILDGTIASNDLSQMGAANGEVMKWNGSAWIASADISNAGTVTSVTAAATANNPIAIGGTGAAPTIDLAKATTAINGYLSSTDFTTFNNKQAGSTELTGVATLSTIGFVKRTAANTYSTVASIDLTNSVTGVLPATNGGSGQSSFAIGDLLYANSTTTLAKLAASTSGYVLTTNGAGTAPTWTAAGAGTVTGVTATAPVVSSGGTAPVISMAQSTTTISGYLSSTDFTTFNSKQASGNYITALTSDVTLSGFSAGSATATIATSAITSAKILDGTIASNDLSQMGASTGQVMKWTGSAWIASADISNAGTVTSVTAAATANNPITVGGTGAAPTIDLAKATTAINGYLSSTDFTTFNNKQTGSTELTGVAALSTIGFVKRTAANTYSTVASIDLTNSVTGVLPATNGGSGQSSFAIGDLLYANSTTTLAKLAASTSGYVLTTNGAGTAPTWTAASTGTVTGVTATAPVVSSGGTAPVISMAQSTTAINGYLSSTDFTTFNAKQPAGNYITALTSDVTLSGFSAGSATATIATSAITSAKILDGAITSADLTSSVATALWSINGSGDVSRTSGNVGIGTAAPRTTLDVNGPISSAAAPSNATATISFASGNLQYTTSNCGAFNLHNMKDGASYSFAVQGATAATCSFLAYSDAGTTTLTVHLPTDHSATIASKHTLYTFLVMGTHVYVAWSPGL